MRLPRARAVIRRLALLTLGLGATLASASELEIVSVEPTPLFPNAEPLRQLVNVTLKSHVTSWKRTDIKVVIEFGAQRLEQYLWGVPSGESTQALYLPDSTEPTALKLRFLLGNHLNPYHYGPGVAAEFTTTWQPPRHWTVYITKTAHTDLGYEGYEHAKRADLADYIDDARRLADATSGAPDKDRYVWTIEHLHWFYGNLAQRPWPWLRNLVEQYIKPGRMALAGVHSGVHSQWQSTEQLCRGTYFGRRQVKDQFGLDLPLYLIADNPSVAWPAAQAWAQAGGRYIVNFNAYWWRTKWALAKKEPAPVFKDLDVPSIFWWQAPDERHKVLFCFPGYYNMWYYEILHPGYETMRQHIPAFLRSIEQGQMGHYPYDLLLAPAYKDHSPPYEHEAREVAQWNAKWRYPELRIDDPANFMRAMERRYGDQIPTLSGEINNSSADYAAINSDLMGLKRATAWKLPVAETYSSIANLLDPTFPMEQPAVNEAWWALNEFDEHSWPTGPKPEDFHEANVGLIKVHNAQKASAIAVRLMDRSVQRIASAISARGPSVAVFNTTGHRRTDPVTVRLTGGVARSIDDVVLVDPATGRAAALQKLSETEGVFIARDVPSLGYKSYRIESLPGIRPASPFRIDRRSIENQFYKITLDEADGTIRSIYDKELERELVDHRARHRFNQLIYYRAKQKHGPGGTEYVPTRAVISIDSDGPVTACLKVQTQEEQSRTVLTQYIRLYDGLKRVELTNSIGKSEAMWSPSDVMTGAYDAGGQRYLNNIFFAFPFDVPQAEIRADYAIGTVRPHTDQLPLGNRDYLAVQQWVNCGNDDFHVTWATPQAPIVHFGEIRYNRFSTDYQPKQPYLYSYAMSNRMAGLIGHHPERCGATVRYAITSGQGTWQTSRTPEFGEDQAVPLHSTVIHAAQPGALPGDHSSFVEVDAPNVQILVLKPGARIEGGYVLRLVETQGRKQTPVRVTFPHAAFARAAMGNMVEDEIGSLPLQSGGRQLTLSMGQYEVATIILRLKDAAPGLVRDLQTVPADDQSIRLKWAPVEGAAMYNIYRLPAAGEKACLEFLAGQAKGAEFTDQGLNLDREYIYHVAAVGPGNEPGPLSEARSGRTRSENTSPPARVREVVPIERSCSKVLLAWLSSPEPDVIGYEIHRAESEGFIPNSASRLGATEKPAPHYRQIFVDETVAPGRTYFYQIVAVDSQGLKSAPSKGSRIQMCPAPESGQ